MGCTAVSFNGQWGHAVKEVDFIDRNTIHIGPTSMDKAKANLKVVSMSANSYFHFGPETILGVVHTNGIKDSDKLELLVIEVWSYDRVDPRQEKVEIEIAH